MVTAYATVTIVWTAVWLRLAHSESGIRLAEFILDISPYLLLAAALCIMAQFTAHGIDNIYMRLAAKILLVAVPYIAILWCLGSTILKESIHYILKRKL